MDVFPSTVSDDQLTVHDQWEHCINGKDTCLKRNLLTYDHNSRCSFLDWAIVADLIHLFRQSLPTKGVDNSSYISVSNRNARLPVRATFVPSRIPVSLPRRIHPISLRISCTIPLRPFSSNDFCIWRDQSCRLYDNYRRQ